MARAFAQLGSASFSSDGTIYMTYNVTYVDPVQIIVEERQVPVVMNATDSAVGMQIKLSAAIKQGGADLGLVVTNEEITQPAYLKGITVYQPVRAMTTGNIDINNPGDTFDGVQLNPESGERLLVRLQTNAAENGLYVFHAGNEPLTRASDADDSSEVVNGASVLVTEGNSGARSQWMVTYISPAPWTIGTSLTAWSRFVLPFIN